MLADPDVQQEAAGAAVIAVDFTALPNDVIAVSLDVDAHLLDAIDLAARKRGLTRSAFLAEALRDKVAG